MTNAAVADPTNATQTGAEAPPNKGEGTDPNATSQAAAGADGAVNDPEISPAQREAALKLAESMLPAMVEKRMEDQAKEARQQQRQGYRTTSKADVSKAFTDTAKASTDDLSGPFTVEIEDGQGGKRQVQFQLPAEVAQKVVNRWNGYHSTADEKYSDAVLRELADHADEQLPNDEARAAFESAAADKDLGEWLTAFTQTQLLHLPIIDGLLPDKTDREAFRKAAAGKPLATQLKELNTAVDARIALIKATAFTAGKTGLLGEPSSDGGKGTGTLTKESFLAMTPTERAQAWRERPDEVNALK